MAEDKSKKQSRGSNKTRGSNKNSGTVQMIILAVIIVCIALILVELYNNVGAALTG